MTDIPRDDPPPPIPNPAPGVPETGGVYPPEPIPVPEPLPDPDALGPRGATLT